MPCDGRGFKTAVAGVWEDIILTHIHIQQSFKTWKNVLTIKTPKYYYFQTFTLHFWARLGSLKVDKVRSFCKLFEKILSVFVEHNQPWGSKSNCDDSVWPEDSFRMMLYQVITEVSRNKHILHCDHFHPRAVVFFRHFQVYSLEIRVKFYEDYFQTPVLPHWVQRQFIL